MYIPPQADPTVALKELYLTLCKLETIYPEAVDGDLNKANFRTRLPKIYCTTRRGNMLNHCYSNFRDAYKTLPCPSFGKSDHDSIFLLPSYRQKFKQDVPVTRTIQHWSDQSESMLQDCFDHADWDMFRSASDN